MSVDYRVTLGCGHIHDYRTTVHPYDRERLMCSECGPDQLPVRVRPLSTAQRLFSDFAPRRGEATGTRQHVPAGDSKPTADETGAMQAIDAAWPANEYSAADLLAAYRAGSGG